MRNISHWWIRPVFGAGLGTILALYCWIPAAAAQPRTSGSAVDNLRRILDSKIVDRTALVETYARALHGINDLRRALALPGWRVKEQPIRHGLLEKFLDEVAKVVKSSDRTDRLAAATLIGDMSAVSANLPAADEDLFTHRVTPLLVSLMKDGQASVRETAARSLARINTDPKAAAGAYLDLLGKNHNTVERRMAAAAQLSFVSLKLQLFEETREGIKVTRQDLVALGDHFVAVAGKALRDSDAVVRRLGLESLQRLAQGLTILIPVAKAEDSGTVTAAVVQKEWAFVQPLVEKLAAQGKTLAGLLSDPDEQVRLLARRALSELARARLRLLLRQASIAPTQGAQGPRQGERVFTAQKNAFAIPDVMGKNLQPAVTVLARGIRDPNPEVRLAAIGFLELLEDAAAPAASALIATLPDPNKFVRWAAARTLGRISTLSSATIQRALPGLARLLADSDLDLRLAAADSLAEFGPDAAPAVPALIRASQTGDTEIRMAALQTLVAVGLPKNADEAARVIAAAAAGLMNPDARVRQAAAETLGAFGPASRAAVPALRRALSDDSMEVQSAVSGALLDIAGK